MRNGLYCAAVTAIVSVAGTTLIPAAAFGQEEPPPQAEPAEAPEAQPEGQPGDAPPQVEQDAREPAAGVQSEDDLTDEQRVAYETHLRAGKAAYANQNFDLAFAELQKAYAIHAKPSILFNMALIAEKGGALERSVEYYQRFLSAPGVTLENRKRASDRLAAVQEILATSESAQDARQRQEVTDLLPALEAMGIESTMEPAPDGTETAQTASTTPQPTDTTPQTDESAGATGATSSVPEDDVVVHANPDVDYTWPVYASFGVATAALVGGVAMVAMTNDRIEEGKAAGQAGDDAGLAAAEEDASMYATTAAGLFIGGAVMAVVGGYFVVRNSMDADSDMQAESGSGTARVSFSLHKNFLGPIFSLSF